MNSILIEATNFAARAHQDQTRKVDNSPYLNHLLEVCNILRYAGLVDEKLLSVAILHDVIDHTDATFAQLSFLFGNDIAGKVEMLSDDKSLSAQERKLAVERRLAVAQDDYIAIKLADLISNISAIPKLWDEVKVEQYLTQCAEVIKSIPVLGDARLKRLIELAIYTLDAQTTGLTIYNKLCELARQEQLYWSAKHNVLIVIDDEVGHQLTGYCIEGDISSMFQIGLLRSLQRDGSSPVDINIAYSIDEDFNDASFEHHQQIMSAMRVVVTR